MGRSRRLYGELREWIWASAEFCGEVLGISVSGYVEPARPLPEIGAAVSEMAVNRCSGVHRSPKTLTFESVCQRAAASLSQTLSRLTLPDYRN